MSQSNGTRGYNLNLHGLRGVSALWIFLTHFYLGASTAGFYPQQWPALLADFFDAGHYAVDLFFLISGYLITESLIKKHDLRRFLVDRAIRIYPAFLVAMLPLAVVGMLTHQRIFAETPPHQWPLIVLANLLLLPGVVDMQPILGVAWTLSFEALFYLTAAASYALVHRGYRRLAVALCLIVGAASFHQYSGVIAFFVGALTYLYHDRLTGLTRGLHLPVVALIAFVGLWGYFNNAYWNVGGGWRPEFVALGALCFAIELWLFNSIVSGAGAFGAFLRSGFIQFFGTISYSFYLWHTPVMYVTKRIVLKAVVPSYGDLAGTLTFGFLSFLAAALIGYLSCRIFERAASRVLHTRFVGAPGRKMAQGAIESP